MRTKWNRGLGAIAAAWALTHPAGASGQMTPLPATSPNQAMPPGALLMNPYLNPYLNPYMNPGATQQPMSPANAALFLYSAQAANGGFGSGRLSGTRPAPGGAVAGGPATTGARPAKAVTRGGPGERRAAEMPDSASVPGAGAARFFNPGPVNVGGAGRYYSRRDRHFQNNGR